MTGKPKPKSTKRGHSGSSSRSAGPKSRPQRSAAGSGKAAEKRTPAPPKGRVQSTGPRTKPSSKRADPVASRKSATPLDGKVSASGRPGRSGARTVRTTTPARGNSPRTESLRVTGPPPWEAEIFPRARRDVKPVPLTKSDVRFLWNRLLADRSRLVIDLGKLESAVLKRSQRDAAGDLSAYSTHMDDLGADAMSREKDFQLASAEGRMVALIDDALRKMDEGTYGECESCGGPIGRPRLEVVPHAVFCIQCQEKIERSST